MILVEYIESENNSFMKIFIITTALFITSIVSGQSLSIDFKAPLETDNAETFKALVNDDNLNACFDVRDSSYSLLILSIKGNAINCFNVLLDKKIDLEKVCTSKTPLMYAVKYGKLEMVKALANEGANVKAKTDSGKTALYYAKKYDQNEIEKYLESL